jgi:hypothetical protein
MLLAAASVYMVCCLVVKRDCIHLKISQHWFYKTLTKVKRILLAASTPNQVLAPPHVSYSSWHAADAARVQFMCVLRW